MSPEDHYATVLQVVQFYMSFYLLWMYQAESILNFTKFGIF